MILNNIFEVNKNINIPKLVQSKEIIEIGKNLTIEKGLYEKRGSRFYDIILKNNDKEIFFGRFLKENNDIYIDYTDGKILISQKKYDNENKIFNIIKVMSLYEIIDNTFYSCTEEEALQIFDSTIDTSNLINGNNSIVRTDVEKLRRLK